METAYLTSSEIAEITGLEARTIQKRIKTGKLSGRKNESGNYIVDKAEFYRVYPEHMPRETKPEPSSDSRLIELEYETKYQREIIAELKSLNALLTEQLRSAGTEKSALIETLSSNQRLLEYQSDKPKKKGWFR